MAEPVVGAPRPHPDRSDAYDADLALDGSAATGARFATAPELRDATLGQTFGLWLGVAITFVGVVAGHAFDRTGDDHPMLMLGAVVLALSAAGLLALGLVRGRHAASPSLLEARPSTRVPS